MSRTPHDKTTELAQKGLDTLEQQLMTHPPEGVTASEVAAVFQRQRPALVAALAGMLGAISESQGGHPASARRGISASDRMLKELERLLDDGEEHQLVVLAGKEIHIFGIMPDVDGLYVALEGSPDKERKLDRTDAAALLDFVPIVCPPAAGGMLIAVRDWSARLEESTPSEWYAIRDLHDSLTADGKEPEVAFDLAVRLHRAVMKVRPDAWRGVRAREQVIKGALYDVLRDEEETERIMRVVRQQSLY